MSEKNAKVVLLTRLIASVVILSLAIGGTMLLVYQKPVAERKDDDAPPRSVRVVEVKPLPVRRQWRGYGTAQAQDTSDVPARVTTTVKQMPDAVEAGQRIDEGDVIVQLDASDFEREVEIIQQNIKDLEAQLSQIDVERRRLTERVELEQRDTQLAETQLQRVRSLEEQGAANQTNLDDANRQLIAAERSLNVTREALDRLDPRRAQLLAQRAAREASLRLARENVARCQITSPITGVLEAVDVEPGESVTAGQRVARVVNLSTIEVPLRLPASARRKLDLQDQVTLQATNESALTWNANVSRIAPVDDADARTVTVYMEVSQPAANDTFMRDTQNKLLLPGMFVAGVVTHSKVEQRWVVPRRSVRSDRIMLVDDHTVASRRVKVDFMLDGQFVSSDLDDDQWAVLDVTDQPLTAGDRVIVDGGMSLLDGETVSPQVLHINAASASDALPAAPDDGREGSP